MRIFSLMYFHCIWCVFLLIERAESDEVNEMIKKCVDRQLETKFELPLEIVNDKGELELWIRYNGKYDLYQTYNNGHIYHQEWQLSEKITPRTGPNRANCSNYLPPEANWYGCPYTISEDEFKVNITLESFLRRIIYSIDKSTKNVDFIKSESGLYGPTQDKKHQECVDELRKYVHILPVEINIVENHIETIVKYQGKYDFYNTISLGTICGIQYQLDEKPAVTIEEYGHCSKCGNSAELYAWCPYKINESDNEVTLTLEAFFYKNVYTVNKSTREIRYEKSLIGKDPHKEYEQQINDCKDGLSEVDFTLPIRIIRNDNFLEIWIKRNDKYDIFETSVSGSICKNELQSSRDPNVTVSRAPAECFSPGLDVPYYFICPYQLTQDEDFVYFRVHSSDQYLYALNKLTGTLVFRQFPTIYDSGHQGTVTYLRSVVMDPNYL